MTTDPLLAVLDRIASALEAMAPRRLTGDRFAELLAAIAEEIGAGCPFTAAGLLMIADDEPHKPIGDALARLIDLGAPGRAIALGKLLASCEALERSRRAGVLLYVLPEGIEG